MVEDVEVVLVPRPSHEELGRLLCDLLSRYRYVRAVRALVRNAGIMVSHGKVVELLDEFCPDLYHHLRKLNVKRYLLKKLRGSRP